MYDIRTNLSGSRKNKYDLMGLGKKLSFANKENNPGPFKYNVLGYFDKIAKNRNRGISFSLSR